jgi:hypothetical protein
MVKDRKVYLDGLMVMHMKASLIIILEKVKVL